jgi:transglutaminase-like putative cysteine protease
MSKYSYISLIVILSFLSVNGSAQFKLPFGNIFPEDLLNKPYKPDPGADALVLAERGVATLKYQRGFYVEFETDVRIRIVNSKGFDYADIEIPFSSSDDMVEVRASTFNLRNGEVVETKIPKKSFIREKSSEYVTILKFNFPDVHEGSVLEYSYKIRLKSSVNTLVPWDFQYEIPVVKSLFTAVFPDAFVYKSLITGSVMDVQTDRSSQNTMFFGQSVTTSIITWMAKDVPAFRDEPYILSRNEHFTRLTFELARVDFPSITYEDISPTYKTLSKKLLYRSDFGSPIATNFESLAGKITRGQSDQLDKLKKIHNYITSNILWNGVRDFSTSSSLRTILRKKKGNSAELNMLLIAMLRSVGVNADPVILSTRSNGSLNENSAMLQQFNYVVALVKANGEEYLVDATDPLRPFDQLPFDCLNKSGRLISETDSRFVDLKNSEKYSSIYKFNLNLDASGNIEGKLEYDFSGYSAYLIRKQVKMESEEGYIDDVKLNSPTAEISDFKISGVSKIDSDITLKCNCKISSGAQVAGDELILNPFLSPTSSKNPFNSRERKFPVDFGCPSTVSYSVRFIVPDGYSVSDKPPDASVSLGKSDGKYDFSCKVNGNEIVINSLFSIGKTYFLPSDYTILRNFYTKVFQKESELIVLKKNPVSK